MEGERTVGEVETIGKIVGCSVSVAERGQFECGLDELQDAAEVVCGV